MYDNMHYTPEGCRLVARFMRRVLRRVRAQGQSRRSESIVAVRITVWGRGSTNPGGHSKSANPSDNHRVRTLASSGPSNECDQPFCRLVLDFERYARTVGALKPYSLQDYAGTSHGPAREEAGSAELAPCPAACVRGASVFESTRKRTSRTVISLSGAA